MSTPLHVHELGDGPVIVMIHAFPCDGRMWHEQMRAAAAAGWRALAPDLPGFGQSPLLDGDPDLDAVTDAVLAVMDERDIERAVVAGASLGGYVAMAMLRRRPNAVAGLVLCGTKASADGDAALANRERLAGLVEDAPADTARILEQAVLPGLLGDTSRRERPDVVERVREWLAAAPADTVAWYQRAMAARPDSVGDIADVDPPTLVVWGEEDALSDREEQDRMVSAPSDGRLVAVAGAGHLVNLEAADDTNAALTAFLGTVRGPRHA